MNSALQKHKSERKLTTLVENYTVYQAAYSELNIFETHQRASQVSLTFDYPVLASMLTGKKQMHLEGMNSFDFVPGESVVMPSGRKMIIDFPIATNANPTQCLALTIDPQKINETVGLFNDATNHKIENNGNWTLDNNSYHLDHDPAIQQLIDRLLFVFVEGHASKDIFIDGILKELIIRILQSKARGALLENTQDHLSDHRIAYSIEYIKSNLSDSISIDELVDKACMSKSHFFKIFKNTLGLSPIDYITAERIKLSKKLIKNTNLQISQIAYDSGFNNVSYFTKKFKEYARVTPSVFKKESSIK